ncbi:MAG: aldehyde ferredoxin oxidoreductase family protein, partial [Firmicutes bacterium]|nr:aldehyde ferredoxin oxidoreductase family protein [Bacillota bacterium]
ASEEPIAPEVLRKYLGARGVAAWYYRREIGPDVDPVSPENRIIFMTGPLTGTPLPSTTKFGLATKSPETGGYLCSNSSGFAGPYLKCAGFDGLVVMGRAPEPVYILIDDGEARVEDAGELWDLKTAETEQALKKRHGPARVGVASIGPAAVSGAAIACVMVDGRSFGRGGAGAVMASKNLKAVVVRGTGEVPLALPQEVRELGLTAARAAREGKQAHTSFGTAQYTDVMNELGCYPTRNFTTAVFEGIDTVKATYMVDHYKTGNRACYRCPVACAQVCEVKDGPFKGAVSDPEYETIGAFGGQCGISDFGAIVAANQFCDEYGLDTMSSGTIIAYAMECYERGLFATEQTGGVDLRFGNAGAMLEVLRQMGEGKGLGRDLASGFRALAVRYPETVPYMMHAKWMPFAAYEPRGFHGIGLGFGTSVRGACHNVGGWTIRDELLTGQYDRFAVVGKGELVKKTQDVRGYVDSLGLCTVVRSSLGFTDNPEGKALEYVTGVDFTRELMEIGERVICLERTILVREGRTRADDMLPDRIMTEPLPEGMARGRVLTPEMYNTMLDEYYTLRGWDPNGVPNPERLRELGIDPEG